MKKLTFFLVTMVISTTIYCQWQTVYQFSIPSLPNLQSVAFTNFYKGFAAGGTTPTNPAHPIIIRTIDNGTTWDTTYTSNDSGIFRQVVFIDSAIAVAVGMKFPYPYSGIIAKTSDFGNTWTTTYTASELTSVCFPTSVIGYAVGDSGTVLKTTNGGISWNTVNISTSTRLTTVAFVDGLTGFVSGDNVIHKTVDGGLSWTSSIVGNYIYGAQLFFPSVNAGYFKSHYDSTAIYKTTDLGVTWTLQGKTGWTYMSMFFPNDSTGYLAGQFILSKTTDNGITLNTQSTSPSMFWDNFTSVFLLNNDTGFGVGHDQYYRTINASGIASVNQFSSDPQHINIFPNPSNGVFTITNQNNMEMWIELYNALGEKVYTSQFLQPGSKIDLSDLTNGIYIIKISTEEKSSVQKVIIQK